MIPVPATLNQIEESTDTEMTEFDSSKDGFQHVSSAEEALLATASSSTDMTQAQGIFPAARARLASIANLGAKKIGALKLKLIENKIKSNERGITLLIDTNIYLETFFINLF